MPGLSLPGASLADYRFFGIERIDLRARYGARCDGSSHTLQAVFGAGNLAAAQTAYANAGITSGNFATMEIDTAALLQAEYDLRAGAGGIIGLADGASLMASQTLWLQNGGKVAFHGGRNTKVLGENCGSTPVLRVSNASGNTSGSAQGAAQNIPFRNLTVFAWNAGRAYFSSGAGAAAPGYATAAAMSGNPGGYRTGSCALQIDDGGAAGQSSGLSGPASVYATIEAVRCFNFDETIRWGDNTFSMILRNFMAENNNHGLSWSQTTNLNSMERMVVDGGSYSNNNYGLYIASFVGSSPQGGSWFIKHASIDYNLVAQGVFNLANAGNGYPQSSLHMSESHIENNAATLGAAAPWFTLQGRASWAENEWYINGSPPSTGLVLIGDNSSGSMVNNRIGGSAPLFFSTTSNSKSVHAVGNECNPVGAQVIALKDSKGTALQARRADEAMIAEPYSGTFTLDPALHGNLSVISLEGSLATFAFPAEGSSSFRGGWQTSVQNTRTSAVTISVPSGVVVAGCFGYAGPTGGSTDTSHSIPANTFATLLRRDNQWVFVGGMTMLPT